MAEQRCEQRRASSGSTAHARPRRAVDATGSRKHSSRNAFGQPDGPRAKAPPPSHVAQDAGSQGPRRRPTSRKTHRHWRSPSQRSRERRRRRPRRRHVAQDGTPKPPRKPHADTPAAGAVAKPPRTRSWRPRTGRPRHDRQERLAARHCCDGRSGSGDSDEGARRAHGRSALSGGSRGRGGYGGSGRAGTARASAEEVADEARASRNRHEGGCGYQEAEAKSALKRAPEADAPAEKAVAVLEAKAKAVEPARPRRRAREAAAPNR